MHYRKINNLTGWLMAAIAFTVYFLTMEPTASFWDCGEFLSCAYKVEVGHSPGAPFFMLLQRFFSLFSGTAAWTAQPSAHAAFAVNLLSVLSSALTILFLFWTITHMAHKMVVAKGATANSRQALLLMATGIVGALAYTFSDTFWFSAVEAEVYATSSFFTVLVFWAVLKWELVADEPYADRWLLLIAFLVGVSVGVHLLNLLTIPAIGMVYYFRKYKATPAGIVKAFLAGCLLLALVQFGIIQYLPILASGFDLFFVNQLGLPFNSGAVVCLLLVTALLVWGLIWAQRKNRCLLHSGLLCIIFILIGFSTYIIPIIRSVANTPVDVNNPDNIVSLVPYVQREQYIHPPLLYGHDFDSPVTGMKVTGKKYYGEKRDGKAVYNVVGEQIEYEYDKDRLRFFPRIWDNYEPSRAAFYRNYLGLSEGEMPTMRDNLAYFFSYQMDWLWWRYFMWNYAGRQNDFEGQGDAKNGNWISGIPFLDKMRVGDIEQMPDSYRNNKARNELYFLPLIAGILGLIFHFNREKKDAFIVALLFFFTGIAIALYLNMNPMQPRERDYAFAGCTYAFAIWIGFGVLFMEQVFRKISARISVVAAFVLCLLAVPVLMAKEEWDDHDRSGKSLARATAWNALMSCAPNAILFTTGDNDTYPLWYLQEVEGIRPDVRVIITELLNADWYIDQLTYKINDADAVPMVWKKEDYMGDHNNYVRYYDNPAIPKDRYFDVYEFCQFISNKDNMLQTSNGKPVGYLPTKNLFIPLQEQGKRGKIADTNDRMYFTLQSEGMQKKELAVLNIIAAVAKQGWKRPIYFNGSYGNREDMLGLGIYMRMEGIVQKLAPFTPQDVDTASRQVNSIDLDKSMDHFLTHYKYGGAEKDNLYFDEKNRVMLLAYRLYSAQLADRLSSSGRQEEAVLLLDKMAGNITEASYPHDAVSMFTAEAYYHAGAKAKAAKLAGLLARYARRDINFITGLPAAQQPALAGDLQRGMQVLQRLSVTAGAAGDQKTVKELKNTIAEVYPKVAAVLNLK